MVWCGLCRQEVPGTSNRALSLHQNRYCRPIFNTQPAPKEKRPKKRRQTEQVQQEATASGSSFTAAEIQPAGNESVRILFRLFTSLNLYQVHVESPEPMLLKPEPMPLPKPTHPELELAPPDPEPEPAPTAIPPPRTRRLPKRLLEFPFQIFSKVRQLQRPPSPIPEPIQHTASPPAVNSEPELDRLPSPELHEMEPDEFGLYRAFVERPSHESDDSKAPDYGCNAPTFDNVHNTSVERRENDRKSEANTNLFAPFANATKFRLTNWIYSMTKSNTSFDSLVNDVIKAEDFDVDELEDWNTARELKTLEQYSTKGPSEDPFRPSDGWLKGSVKIPLPFKNRKWKSEADAPQLEVFNIPYRNLVEVIKSACKDSEFYNWHLKGYKQMWKPSEDEPVEQVYGEVWLSNQYLVYEDEVRKSQLNAPVNPRIVETVVLPLMSYSDQTHLAQFGTASLWPMYMAFGLLSKYIRSKPSSLSWHHIIYFPSVSLMSDSLSFLPPTSSRQVYKKPSRQHLVQTHQVKC